jgi:GAF domain-containing protein
MTSPPLAQLARLFDDVEARLQQARPLAEAMDTIVTHAMQLVEAADAAGISVSRSGAWRTIASSGPLPLQVDALQYELGDGPCLDAALKHITLVADDLPHDPRWPEFGPRAARETGVLSMMSHRMYIEDTGRLVAGLNFYARKKEAFAPDQQILGTLLANHGALILTSLQQADEIDNLNRALESNRDIGTAIGILMALHKITQQDAFRALTAMSQRTHRKLRDVALDVIQTGSFPEGR